MLIRKSSITAAFAIASMAAAAILLGWLFGLQGTLGLARWNGYWPLFIGIGIAGILPLALAGAYALVSRAGAPARGSGLAARAGAAARLAPRILATLAIGLASLSLAADGGLFGALQALGRRMEGPAPALAAVEIAKGIPGSGGTVRLSISSDPHWGSPNANPAARTSILRAAASAVPRRDAFIILGDNVEVGMLEPRWRDEARELSTLLGDLPLVALLGNHDAIVFGEYHYQAFFPASGNSDSGSPYYYAMEAGTGSAAARIVVLNLLWGAESFDAAQRAWLERTLSSTPKGEPVIVLSHCFFYSSGYVDEDTGMPWYDHPETIAAVSPILERYRVALVVSGHNHYMELLEKNGVTYAVVGAMGGKPDPIPSYASPASKWFSRGLFGRLDLDISAEGIALSFKDQDGTVLKEASIPR